TGRRTFDAEFFDLLTGPRRKPLLLLNASAIPSATRLVISHLDLQSYPNRAASQLSDYGSAGGLPLDVTLSTAISLSARFPLITPHGELWSTAAQGKGSITSYVADGGFVDNYGAATALEIVEQFDKSGYDPVVVLITNDPRAPE